MKSRICITWMSTTAVLAVGAVAVMLYMAFTAEHARLAYDFSEKLDKVTLQGQFRTGSEAWQTYPPKNMDRFRTVGEETVELSGHVLHTIPKDKSVFVSVRHVRATLAVNGNTVFQTGTPDTMPAFTRSPGSMWASFKSPGISPEDTVSIILQRVNANSHPHQIDRFLESIYTGSSGELLRMELLPSLGFIPLASLFITLGFLLVALAALLAWHSETTLAIQSVMLSGIYISTGLWALIDYDVLSLIIPYPTAIIAIELFLLLSATVFIVLYVATMLTDVRKNVALCCASLLFILIFIAVVLQLTGFMELFVVQKYLKTVAFCSIVMCIILSLIESRFANTESMRGFMTFVPLCFLAGTDLVFSALGPVTNGIFAIAGFFIAAVLQIFHLISAAYQKMEQANKLEQKLMESRVDVSLSQIRPHFLYNILTSIQYLCAENPARAEQAISEFTIFLRGNLDSLSSAAPIPLMQELEHVRHYLALEQLRYGEKLRVEWNLLDENFAVPALSIQPLAENAVQWGMREDGLTVRITSQRTSNGFVVTVEDDGQGFDPQTPCPPRGKGVGLASIRTRVHNCYGGSLKIESAPQKGTKSTLLFPQHPRGPHEHHSR